MKDMKFICEVGNARQADDGNIDRPALTAARKARGETVLIVDIQMHIRPNARHRHAAQLLERFESRLKDLLISAEFVDDGAADARSLVRLEQGHGAVELCEHAAAVNVAVCALH